METCGAAQSDVLIACVCLELTAGSVFDVQRALLTQQEVERHAVFAESMCTLVFVCLMTLRQAGGDTGEMQFHHRPFGTLIRFMLRLWCRVLFLSSDLMALTRALALPSISDGNMHSLEIFSFVDFLEIHFGYIHWWRSEAGCSGTF